LTALFWVIADLIARVLRLDISRPFEAFYEG